MGIPEGITRDHVLAGIEDYESSFPHEFGPSTTYDLVHGGKRYPPKAILGLAARHATGHVLTPADFSGGESSKCFRILRSLKFTIDPKDGIRSSMNIDLAVLDRAVNQNIRPCLIDDGRLLGPKGESYQHQKVIPTAQPLLTQQSLQADAKSSLESALKASTNLLTQFDVVHAVDFVKLKPADEVRKHALDLLHGDAPLLTRVENFHRWAKVRDSGDGKKVGINLTTTSYLLAMSDPTLYAFCKPSVYAAAAKALMGVGDEGNTSERLVHTTELYKAALILFQDRYGLPFEDLQHVHIAFYLMNNPYEGYPSWSELSPKPGPHVTATMHDLKTILYGPPGTGKTYDTIRRAVEICDGSAPPERPLLVKRFDELRKESRVSFVTFHQAYGYEDFIEGLRPVLADGQSSTDAESSGDIQYECRPGIFKQICELASVDPANEAGGDHIDWSGVTVWKMSLGDTGIPDDASIFEDCIKNGLIRLGYGGHVDFSVATSKQEIFDRLFEADNTTKPTDYDVKAVELFRVGMKEGDLVVISDGNRKFRAVARITGPYTFLDTDSYRQARPVQWLVRLKESLSREVIYEKEFSQMTIYRLRDDKIRHEALTQLVAPTTTTVRNYVLIIDEINRGNISKILGELITLLEHDKRLGSENELQVTLPYSGESFGVPQNVFVIGTMNTADRSIAFLDVALRRRFRFMEMMPDYSVLRECWKQVAEKDGFDIAQLLEVLNARIELLYDRDHQIGHAFFMGAKSLSDLRDVFVGKVIPLLQEYFYSDWGKVSLVLGCPVNSESSVLQTNAYPMVVARSLKAASRLADTDEFDDKVSFTINQSFADATTSKQLQPYFEAVMTKVEMV
jgi:5-methylcytosine-specific restriction protein B